MTRHLLLLLSLASLAALVACSGDEQNAPPSVEIVYPDPGYRFTSSPDSVVASAIDDRGIKRVEFFLDGDLISTVTRSPYSTRLPLGIYADGQTHKLAVRATDSNGLRSGTPSISISVDPTLQTVPQITTFGLDDDGSGNLRLSWLEFPTAVASYEWEVARDDGFYGVAASGSTIDTTVVVAVNAEGLAYARLRAVTAEGATDWSRPERFSRLTTWRHRYQVPGPQLGTGIYQAGDGTLRILSHGVALHRVSRATVQLIALDEDNELAAVHDLLDDSYRPTAQALDADGNLRLAGAQEGAAGFVAAADLEGELLWTGAADFMRCGALLQEEDGSWRTVGVDLRDGAEGGVFATVGADGSVTAGETFVLEAGREVLYAWHRPEGGYVVAGQMPDADDGQPGGIWIRGLDADYTEAWNLRFGTGRRYLLRGAATDGAGNYVLGGIAFVENFFTRNGFILSCDADGRLRWQVTDRDWHLFAGVQPDAGGRWTVVGGRRPTDAGVNFVYDLGLRGFSAAGLSLWEERHRAGQESQGWALAPHPNGGWWAVGTRTYDFADFDLDVLRVDDRGELE